MNEAMGLDDGGMSKLHSECGLLDACLERHGLTTFSTYQRGHKVIDYVLVDRNVMQCIQSIGYEPFNTHIISDHRGIFVDLATPVLDPTFSHCNPYTCGIYPQKEAIR